MNIYEEENEVKHKKSNKLASTGLGIVGGIFAAIFLIFMALLSTGSGGKR